MTYYLQADILFDGDGEILKDHIVEVEDDIIQKVAPSENFNIRDTSQVKQVPVLTPGLWDVHTHMFGGTNSDMLKWMEEPTSLRAIRSTRSVTNLIKAGYTSIRDVGGPYALRLKTAINQGFLPGPNIYAAHKFISQTAGHGDHHSTNLKWQSHEFVDWMSKIADGVAECKKATRENIREGADLIKIFVTGGVFSGVDSPTQAHFTMDELQAIINEAKRFDLPTAAHAHGLQGIKNVIEAGITTVEHGTYLDEETAQIMSEKGTILVPTLMILKVLIEAADELGLPENIFFKAKDTYKQAQTMIKIAIKAEVPIAAGSDLLGLGDATEHGHRNTMEILALHQAGLSPLDALKAATSMGPKTLADKAPSSGCIKENYNADFLVLDKNPIDDLSLLQNPSSLLQVIKNGKLVAREGKFI